jgi:hypothetical protein
MITKTFSAVSQCSDPIAVRKGQHMAFSLWNAVAGTFSATILLQKLIPDDYAGMGYPQADDTHWNTVSTYTAIVEDQVVWGDDTWWRCTCSAYVSGSPTVTMKIS